MGRFLRAVLVIAIIGVGAFWVLTRPGTYGEADIAGLAEDAEAGRQVFLAAGCSSCHAAPGAEDTLVLAGGERFDTPFGTFVAPNISSDPTHGIGAWSTLDVVNAVARGVSPGGAHYFPAFPYSSYSKAELGDLVALAAFLRTLPASTVPSQPHDIAFPYNIRRTVGGWKFLYLTDDWAVGGDLSEVEARGRYLSEALSHCGECHTPRDALGGLDYSRWFQGAPNPSGRGDIPAITPDKLNWSTFEIEEYLVSGFTPDFDSARGSMVSVIRNLADLPPEDIAAIAAYMKRVPPAE